MDTGFKLRMATVRDAEGIREVYRPYVETTAISFEYAVPGMEEIAGRIQHTIAEYPWLVCEYGGTIVGYTYAHKHRERTAYQWSPESTIYLSAAIHGLGAARIMYETLFAILELQGFINVYAGVLSTNERSNRFHRALGFEEIGIFRNIGYKLGKWHSNIWYQLRLVEHTAVPQPPLAITGITNDARFNSVLREANLRLAALAVH